MPLYMDIHTVSGATAEDVAKAHISDLEIQDRYDVEYLKYWFNQDCGKLFCLVEAPSAEAARCVHEQAHGMVAEKLIEVDPELVDSFMGHSALDIGGAALIPGAATGPRDPGVRTVMFTDIVGSTEITSRFGDDVAIAVLNAHDKIVRDALEANAGKEVKHTGDGIMASFFSAASSVRAACQIQAALRDHNEGVDHPVTVRIGISAGEPVEQNDDLFGSTVQLAARLCAQADPGQVLVSNVIADLCIGKGLKFDNAGPRDIKGFEAPVHTHSVRILC